ncbi:MAG: HAD family hydrolase [Ignavibacteria bacterium]|nr:HAD family hydrolase [Ignavibacteria bacterium]
MINKLSIKTVLFDFDDTLFDHHHATREGLRAVWKRYTCFHETILDELVNEYYNQLEKLHFEDVFYGKMTPEEARIERFKCAFINKGVEVDFDTTNNAAYIYRNSYLKNRKSTEGAAELLKKFKKKYKIGIVTNNLINEQTEKLQHLGLSEYVDLLLTSEEVCSRKPEKKIFQTALSRLDSSPENTVMIGDSWDNDIVGAHKIGIKCIWFNRWKKECPDTKIVQEIRSLKNAEYIESLFSVL